MEAEAQTDAQSQFQSVNIWSRSRPNHVVLSCTPASPPIARN